VPLPIREHEDRRCPVMDSKAGAVHERPEVHSRGTQTRRVLGQPRAQTTRQVHSVEAGLRSSQEGQTPGGGPSQHGVQPGTGSAVTRLRQGAVTGA